MVARRIELDEESDQILVRLAQDYKGDLGKALGDLLHAHEAVESFIDACENFHADVLVAQRERAERGFAEGRFTSWEDTVILLLADICSTTAFRVLKSSFCDYSRSNASRVTAL